MSETSEVKENLKLALWSLIEEFRDLEDEQAQKLLDSLLSFLPNPPTIQKNRVILRAKDYYPIGGFVSLEKCKAEWIDNDIIKFIIEGWHYTTLKYKYQNGLYYKIYESYYNVNGRGTGNEEKYENSSGITEDELMLEIKHTGD